MLVAAQFWNPLLVREAGRFKEWIDCSDHYRLSWQRNLRRLRANGLAFGEVQLPAYLIDQPRGGRLAVSS
jgi:hypothetical protein